MSEMESKPSVDKPVEMRVVQNSSGQIHLTNPDGSAFDMSKHVGATFRVISPAAPASAAGREEWSDTIMAQWDYWRNQIASGDTSSAPRDWFEALALHAALPTPAPVAAEGDKS